MSLCNACCDSDSRSSSGRRRSALLLGFSVAFALFFQYSLAPALSPESSNWIVDIPEVGSYIVDSWNDGCENDNKLLQDDCRGNSGVYRVTFFAGVFFILLSLIAMCNPSFNRKSWPAKYILYSCLVFLSIFVPNRPLFLDIYVPFARIGASIFIVIQQIVLIDLAYSWNESWVEKSNEADYQEFGFGKKWLRAILITCSGLYIASLTGIILLWREFSGCHENEAFIVITGVMILITTVVQLLSEQASLLTSAVISLYSTCLCFSSVSKNPDGNCNPRLGEDDPLGVFIGISLTICFLIWAGFSATADSRLSTGDSDDDASVLNDDDSGVQMERPLIEGVVANDYLLPLWAGFSATADSRLSTGDSDDDASVLSVQMERPLIEGVVANPDSDSEENCSTMTGKSNIGSKLWKLNFMLALVTCWVGTSLTEWGSVSVEGDIANPESGDVNMWMIIVSQWVTFGLYSWTLVAPLLFPDREFF
eukprot:CAMPEP_0171322228 /NCGR_PEP_ID=MMETSP0816-20121228/114829_1 /TAXON_ID=420281 /ORGANISM="Proboscia inermis, Strain CCAP1064/1" /LENGTH=479 /DNA_ID=CAMNT_0011820653 /DNA_START=74 /DNA_END=1514 /DNA_ORIENTATION=-